METYTQITIIRLISKFIIFKFFQNSLPELLFLSIHLYQIWELVLCRVCVFVSSTLEMIWSWWFYVYDIACKLQHRYDIAIHIAINYPHRYQPSYLAKPQHIAASIYDIIRNTSYHQLLPNATRVTVKLKLASFPTLAINVS